MEAAQKIVLQLREARRLVELANPHAKRMGLVLLENLAELLLRWRTEAELLFDMTTWMETRQHTWSTRRNVRRQHPELLKFARSQNWITPEEVTLLSYCHETRNAVYHEGFADLVDCDLTIRLLAEFLRSYLIGQRTGRAFILHGCPGFSLMTIDDDVTGAVAPPIPSDIGVVEDPGSQGYWVQVVASMIPPVTAEECSRLLIRKVERMFNDLERRFKFVTAVGTDVGFLKVLETRFYRVSPGCSLWGRRDAPFGLVQALNVYMAVLPIEEKLLLDEQDPVERTRKFAAQLRLHRFLSEPISLEALRQHRRAIENAVVVGFADGLKLFLETYGSLRIRAQALDELAFDLEGYIQHLTDTALGK